MGSQIYQRIHSGGHGLVVDDVGQTLPPDRFGQVPVLVHQSQNRLSFDQFFGPAATEIHSQFDFRASGTGDTGDGFSYRLLPVATYGDSGNSGVGNYEEPNIPGTFAPLGSAVIGAVAGYLSLWSVYWLFKLATGKEGMGYGDFKLLAAFGAWMGWQALPVIILLSALSGIVVTVSQMVLAGRSRHQPIPFGPYLAIAGWIALLWRDDIVQSYLQITGF